jgi:hypothetical protein
MESNNGWEVAVVYEERCSSEILDNVLLSVLFTCSFQRNSWSKVFLCEERFHMQLLKIDVDPVLERWLY